MNVKEMREKKVALWNQAKAITDKYTGNSGMDADDAASFDKIMADVDKLSADIKRAEDMERLNEHMNGLERNPLLSRPRDMKKSDLLASDEYKAHFINGIRTKMQGARVNDYLSEGVAADGGYLVPAEWDSRLIEALPQENVMRMLGTAISTSGDHNIPISTSKPAAAILSEGGTLQFGTHHYGNAVLKAYKLAVGVQVTEELLNDNAYDLSGRLVADFAHAIANFEEELFITGTGTTQPTGVLVDATQAITGVSKLSTDNIIEVVYKLRREYRKNAGFLMNDATVMELRKLKDGNGNYLWQPSMQAGEPDRLLGYPLYTSVYMPTTADSGKAAVAFGDFRYYNIADRGARNFKVLSEAYAAAGMVAFMMTERVDGKLLLPEAVQTITMA